ncbi:MAG: hypothetical protein ACRCTI_12775 [Beijerinckiaceae bacterium]
MPGTTLYSFTSRHDPTLHAFAEDQAGEKLPERLGPWSSTGDLKPGKMLPHGLSRAAAMEMIRRQGFALWRMKPEPAAS